MAITYEQRQELARKMAAINEKALEILKDLRGWKAMDRPEMEEIIRRYAACKLQLNEEDICDNLTIMARISVARVMNISVEELKAMDVPGMCGSASGVLAKRVAMFMDVQKVLDIKIPPEKTPYIQTIQDLLDIVIPSNENNPDFPAYNS